MPGEKMFVLKMTRVHPLPWVTPANENPDKHPFFIKSIPHRYSPYGMKNMNKGDYKL